MQPTTIAIAVICGFLLVIGLWRLTHIPANAGTAWWAYTEALILVALAKFARTPDIADE